MDDESELLIIEGVTAAVESFGTLSEWLPAELLRSATSE